MMTGRILPIIVIIIIMVSYFFSVYPDDRIDWH
jgi:hypothetical protein